MSRLPRAATLCGLALLSSSYVTAERSAADALPRLVLWVWERPNDLRAVDPAIGIAFLAQTVTIDQAGMRTVRRRQPLLVAPDARVIAVTRIEADPARTATFDPGLTRAIANSVAQTMTLPRVRGVQVDYDARASEREFYRQLIRDIREAIGENVPLSMTALASWCVGDDWLSGIPIDEAVPMLFEMGPEHQPFRAVAQSRTEAAEPCRGAVGVSLREPLWTRADGRRVYVFNSKPWTASSVAEARRIAER